MKITIIGAGNIGSAVAACLAKGHLYNEKDIIISTPHTDKLENLHKQFPAIRIMTENQYAISEADIITKYYLRYDSHAPKSWFHW